MIEVEHMGVSPSQAKSNKGNHICPEESKSEQPHELGGEYLHSELSEKHQCEHSVTQNESAEILTGVSSAGIHEPSSGYVAKSSLPDQKMLPKDVSGRNHTEESFCSHETVSRNTDECCSDYMHKERSKEKHQPDSETPPNDIERSTIVSINVSNQPLQLNPEDMNKGHCSEHLQLPPDGLSGAIQTSKDSTSEPLGLPQEFTAGDPSSQQSRLPCEHMTKISGTEQHETTPNNSVRNSGQRRGVKTSKTIKKKYLLRSLRSSDRVLRSKSQEKPKVTESSNKLADVGSSEQRKRRKRKGRVAKSEVADEYSRIRKHLRYLLNRINYEQSLIAAYSAEGWKGLSLEKLKPEKELQRATSEILRRKLKIRDLFQRIDSLCAEGRLPESLFDSEGQIDSEDIFCAKCGSKDLSANNDIILCDGACDRGFHQYCLQPPLLKEDIPPDDEGWLCPGCDCKVDCIELVNKSQGTRISVTDSWQKVFPEAAVAAAGHNQDPNFGLPSDDSDDNDYNPDASETDEKDQGDESSSDESGFTSTSEELEAPANADQYLGLPSDDSEDDDYDPDALDHDDDAKLESSSSDFTSDSEDLGATLEENISSQKDEGPMANSAPRDSKRQKPKVGGKESLSDELVSIMDSTSGQDVSTKKRSIERLDYKRLYDETYGNVASSSSDDEDWSDTSVSRKRKKLSADTASLLANGNTSVSRTMPVTDGLNQNLEETEHKPRRKTRLTSKSKDRDLSPAEGHQNLEETEHKPRRKTRLTSKSKDRDLSPAEGQGGASVSGSSGKRGGSSTYKKLGEAVKQRLYESFKENQYPDRATKESLAKELEMTFQQVNKWFGNTRWSYHNSPSTRETVAKNVSGDDNKNIGKKT